MPKSQPKNHPILALDLPAIAGEDVRHDLFRGLNPSLKRRLVANCPGIISSTSDLSGSFRAQDTAVSIRWKPPANSKALISARHQVSLEEMSPDEVERFFQRVDDLRLRASKLGKDFELEELTAIVLAQRGVDKLPDLEQYLKPSFEKELVTMPHWKSMDRAAEAILAAIRCNRRIVMLGDYDVDGNCSLAIMKRTLNLLGANPIIIQPDRDLHGYGLSDKIMPQILSNRPDLLITLDIGTTSRDQIESLKQKGCFTIVVDHHQPQGDKAAKPNVMCNAWVNINENPKLKDYCVLPASGQAVFLAAKTLQASSLSAEAVHTGIRSALVYGMIGIIADLAQLVGPNRTICKEGFDEFMICDHPGIKLMRLQLGNRPLTAEFIGFYVGPELNATCRMRRGTEFLPGTAPTQALLTTDNLSNAALCFSLIQKYNKVRKISQDEGIELARSLIAERKMKGEPYHFGGVFYIPAAHKGIVGLIASHLSKFLHAPVIVITKNKNGEGYGGSGRAPPGIDLISILELTHVSRNLRQMGGHAPAAGMECADFAHLKLFRTAFENELYNIYCEPDPRDNPFGNYKNKITSQKVKSWVNQYKADLTIPLAELKKSQEIILKTLMILEPCGMGNPSPQVLIPKVKIKEDKRTAAGHRRLILEDHSNHSLAPSEFAQLNSVIFKGSIADRFFDYQKTAAIQDLVIQPSFELPFGNQTPTQILSLQIVFGQDTAFSRSGRQKYQLTALNLSTKRPRKFNKEPQTTVLKSTLEFGELKFPKFDSMQQYRRHFGGLQLRDSIEFRPQQINFLSKQFVLEQNGGPKNLLACINTGGGKTIIALNRAAKAFIDHPNRKVIYLTTDLELVGQAYDMAFAALPLTNEQIVKQTGATTPKKRQQLYEGEGKLFIATPQTFLADITSNPELLSQFSFVVMDEIQIIKGDLQTRNNSQYAYRDIVGAVLARQKKKDPIIFWAMSGTPVSNKFELGLLTKTLEARFDKANMPTGQQVMRIHGIDLNPDYKKALDNMRTAYHDCAKELLENLDKLWATVENNQFNWSDSERLLHSAVVEFKKIHEVQRDGRTMPSQLKILNVRRNLEHSLNEYIKYRENNVPPQVWAIRSRLHELHYLKTLFDELWLKGKIPFIRTALDKIARSMYAGKEADSFSSYKVRSHRRRSVQDTLEWAAESPMAKDLLTAFKRSYPDFHKPGSIGLFIPPKVPPPPWSKISPDGLEQNKIEEIIATIDASLQRYYVENKIFDLKELPLTTAASLTVKKRVIFCEEKFEAELLAARLNAIGGSAEWYAGKSAGSKAGMSNKLARFNNGEIAILCSTSAGETGKDFQDLLDAYVMRPYISAKKNRQTIGRLARKKDQVGNLKIMAFRDSDPDFDQRQMFMIAQHGLTRLAKVGENKRE